MSDNQKQEGNKGFDPNKVLKEIDSQLTGEIDKKLKEKIKQQRQVVIKAMQAYTDERLKLDDIVAEAVAERKAFEDLL